MLEELNPETHQYEQSDALPQEPSKQEQVAAEKERNWIQMRERTEAAERRAQELERMMQNNMSQSQKSQKIEIDDDEDDFGLDNDTYVEGKHLKKQVKSLKQAIKQSEQKFAEMNQRNYVAQSEMRLKSQFTDFDNVVTTDNLNKLANTNPVLHRAIMANSDVYDMGYTAYSLIKSSGIVENKYAEQDRRLEENQRMPRSAANVSPQQGESPLTRVGDYERRSLTEERKLQLLKQVADAKMHRS